MGSFLKIHAGTRPFRAKKKGPVTPSRLPWCIDQDHLKKWHGPPWRGKWGILWSFFSRKIVIVASNNKRQKHTAVSFVCWVFRIYHTTQIRRNGGFPDGGGWA